MGTTNNPAPTGIEPASREADSGEGFDKGPTRADRAAGAPLWRDICERLRAEWKLKLLLMVILYSWVFVPYWFLQHYHFFPAVNMPSTAFDRLIPFSDNAVWLYMSLYLLMPVGPSLMNRRQQILGYALGIVLLGVVADLVFIFLPTCCPRPTVAGTNALYRMVVEIDNTFHAFPSLHAAFAVYSAACGGLVLREIGRYGAPALAGRGHYRKNPEPAKAGTPYLLWIWAGLILYATLATKQHMVWDIIAGSVLGAGVYLLLFGFRADGSKLNSTTRTHYESNL